MFLASTSNKLENSAKMTSLPFSCHFGQRVTSFEDCGFAQDDSDQFDWEKFDSGTPTENTGPANKLSRGEPKHEL